MATPAQTVERTAFLNVDLDIYSKANLKPLVAALGKDVYVLHLGRERGLWSAHLELTEHPRSADVAIRRFTALILALPPAARKLWDSATTRDFNIGVQAGSKPRMWEIKFAPQTIQRVSSLKARLVITVYAATAFSNTSP
jgi:hypothetical protein